MAARISARVKGGGAAASKVLNFAWPCPSPSSACRLGAGLGGAATADSRSLRLRRRRRSGRHRGETLHGRSWEERGWKRRAAAEGPGEEEQRHRRMEDAIAKICGLLGSGKARGAKRVRQALSWVSVTLYKEALPRGGGERERLNHLRPQSQKCTFQ